MFTDHKALQWLKGKKHPNGKIARWLIKLQEYEYTIEHKAGSLMKHAYALSRAPVKSIKVLGYSVDELKELQELDKDIYEVKSWVVEGTRPEEKPDNASKVLHALYNIFNSLTIENSLLCRRWIDDTKTERNQIVLPNFVTKTILKEAHEQVGHLGVAKTFDVIQKKF